MKELVRHRHFIAKAKAFCSPRQKYKEMFIHLSFFTRNFEYFLSEQIFRCSHVWSVVTEIHLFALVPSEIIWEGLGFFVLLINMPFDAFPLTSVIFLRHKAK